MFISVCVCFLPFRVRLISSLFITVTHPSTVNWTSGCAASHCITLPSPICPGNFSVPLRSNLPILPPLRLYLSVTDRTNMGKQTAALSSNRIRDQRGLSRSPICCDRKARPTCARAGLTQGKADLDAKQLNKWGLEWESHSRRRSNYLANNTDGYGGGCSVTAVTNKLRLSWRRGHARRRCLSRPSRWHHSGA